MKIKSTLIAFAALLLSTNAQAQQIHGGEIVSYNTFGEGLMVTRAKMVPLSGMLTNIFFFNRADQPWNGNEWYEYCLLYTSPSPRDATLSRMPSSA